MTHNFTELDDEEIIDFVVTSSELFAKDFDEDFRKNSLISIGSGAVVIIKRAEGFAIVDIGQPYQYEWGRNTADLMVIYVSDLYAGNGIGGELVDVAKKIVGPGISILALCEGAKRKRFFEGQDFWVLREWEENETFEMRWDPT